MCLRLMELSESCQIVTETREIARTAINTLPLNSSLLLQVTTTPLPRSFLFNPVQIQVNFQLCSVSCYLICTCESYVYPLQTLVFELRNCSDAVDQRNLTEWALNRTKERGIAFKVSCSEGNNLLPSA